MTIDEERDTAAVIDMDNIAGDEQHVADTPANDDPEEFVLEVEEDDGDKNPDLVRNLRQQRDNLAKQVKELSRPAQPVEVGPKPDLWENCDGDPDKFEAALLAWNDRKAKAEKDARSQTEASEAQTREFERLKSRVYQRAEALKIADFADAERTVVDAIGPELAGAAMMVCKDPAKLVSVLHRNPTMLAKIEAESNPLLRLRMLWETEGKIVTKSRNTPAPEAETIQRGSAPMSREAPDKRLAALEKKARETGDRTELSAYRRQKGIKI